MTLGFPINLNEISAYHSLLASTNNFLLPIGVRLFNVGFIFTLKNKIPTV